MTVEGGDSGVPPASPADDTGVSAAPRQIGPYRVLEPLGHGGMATVYLAEQQKPVFRRVALKLINLGMDTEQVLARFDAEHQALAMMNHDNIAKVHGAGATERGQPYFVMELVKGLPITEHCDKHKLTTKERLELFAQVCAGVQHAHQKAIIHRDLKPSNILVTEQGDRLVPKIIDFGLARAVDHRLTARTLFTEHGQIVGTPEYMSPEQAEMSSEDIDTRTDVYSLGVILYEMLVGALPFRDLRDAGYLEMQRRIREEDPQKPSTRITSSGDEAAQIAARRRTDRGGLLRELRGDLDWITMRALEKERARRYQTASELAADIDCHLRHVPVKASPPGTLYRVRKFARRNRAVVVSAALVSLTLIGGLVATGLALKSARREAVRADAEAGRARVSATAALDARGREKDARRRAEANEKRAQADAKRAQAMTDFLIGVLASADPSVVRRPDTSVRTLLDQASLKVGEYFVNRPDAEAKIRTTIGKAYASLGDRDQAHEQLRRALALLDGDPSSSKEQLFEVLEALYPISDPFGPEAVAGRLTSLSFEMIRDVSPEFHALVLDVAAAYGGDRTELLFDKVREVERTAEQFAAGHRVWPPYAMAWRLAGAFAIRRLGLPRVARVFLEQSLSAYRDKMGLPLTEPCVIDTTARLVEALLAGGEIEQAESLARDIEERLAEFLPAGHWQRQWPLLMRGDCFVARREHEKARSVLVPAHAATVASVGADSYPARRSAISVMNMYLASKNFDAAARYWKMLPNDIRRVQWARAKRVFGVEHPELWASMVGLDEAISHGLPGVDELWRDVQEKRVQAFGIEDPRAPGFAGVVENWGNVASRGGTTATRADRLSMWREVLEIRKAQDPQDPFLLARTHGALANVQEYAGDFVEGESSARRAVAKWESSGRRTELWARAKNALAGCLLGLGRYREADETFQASDDRPAVRCKLLAIHVARDRADEAWRLWRRGAENQYVRWVHVRRLFTERCPDLATALGLLNAIAGERTPYSDSSDRDARAEGAWAAVRSARAKAFNIEAPLAILYSEVLYAMAAALADGPARDAAHEAMFAEVLAIQERGLAGPHEKTARTLWWLAIKRDRRGAWREGEELARRGLAIRVEVDGPHQSRETAYLRSVLGSCLFRQGRAAEAEPHLVRGYERLVELGGQTQIDTNNAALRLADFYQQRGHPQKAAAVWRKSLKAELANSRSPAWLGTKCAWVASFPGLEESLYELGLKAVDRALKHEPEEAAHHTVRAMARLRLGDSDDALREVECAIDLRREAAAQDFAVLALVQQRRGETTEARAALARMRKVAAARPPRTPAERRLIAEAEACCGPQKR